MIRTIRFGWPLVFAAALSACATAGVGKGSRGLKVDQGFPSTAELEQLTQQPKPQVMQGVGAPAAAARWQAAGDLPTSTAPGPYAGSDGVALTLAEYVASARPDLKVTTAAVCLANEHARFYLAHGADPGEDIAMFVATRCGVTSTKIGMRYVSMAKAPPALDATRDKKTLASMLEGVPEQAQVGLAIAQGDSGVVLAVSTVYADATVVPLAFASGSDGHVEVRGDLGFEPEWVQAYATKGALGFALCTAKGTEGRSGFAFDCATDPNDAHATIEVLAAPRGRLLGRSVARIFVSPDGSLPTSYEAANYALPVDNTDFGPGSLIAAINTLRGRAQLDPVRGEPAQDMVSTNLLPYLLDARDPQTRETAALGLLAGWQVEGIIERGEFQQTTGHKAWTLERTIGAALSHPSFRAQVLNRHVDVLAVANRAIKDARVLLISSYTFFENRTFGAEQSAMLDALDRERAALGVPPVVRVQGGKDDVFLNRAADRIRTGEVTPMDELNNVLTYFSQRTHHAFRGLVMVPGQLAGWQPQFSSDLLKPEHIAVAAKISYYRPEGAAWGQPVVLLAYMEMDGPMR